MYIKCKEIDLYGTMGGALILQGNVPDFRKKQAIAIDARRCFDTSDFGGGSRTRQGAWVDL